LRPGRQRFLSHARPSVSQRFLHRRPVAKLSCYKAVWTISEPHVISRKRSAGIVASATRTRKRRRCGWPALEQCRSQSIAPPARRRSRPDVSRPIPAGDADSERVGIMSGKRQRLSVVSRQGGNPLRAALASAIEAAQEARSALASHDAAIECGRELVNSATAVGRTRDGRRRRCSRSA
jgi:hypothetical protein